MIPSRAVALMLACSAVAGPAAAQIDLPLPQGAVATDQRVEDPGSALVATAPWKDGTIPGIVAEGRITTGAWRLPIGDTSTLALMTPYRDALIQAGFTLMLDCATDLCGGFDFRFAVPVLPEPAMHIDLGDFRYLSARRDGPAGADHVAVLVSRSNDSGFVQILSTAPSSKAPVPTVPSSTVAPPPQTSILVMPPDTAEPEAPAPPQAPTPQTTAAPQSRTLTAQLKAEGHAPLEDLAFASGAADLSPGDYASLAELAEWLGQNPDARITLVGHTDAQGALSANVALSKRRAESVRSRLVSLAKGTADRIGAEGAGYLAPRASNLTDEGRQKNRRVEVILTPTR